MQESILFGDFCDGDTHDIDTWDKLNGIPIEQNEKIRQNSVCWMEWKWQTMLWKECNLPLAASLS